jgi:hypothetical protein
MLRNLKDVRDAVRAPGGGSGPFEAAPERGVTSSHVQSPFVLVECGLDGLWHVYAEQFDTSEGVFNELQDACNHASKRAQARKDLMVLVREKHGSAVNAYYPPAKPGPLSKLFGRAWR